MLVQQGSELSFLSVFFFLVDTGWQVLKETSWMFLNVLDVSVIDQCDFCLFFLSYSELHIALTGLCFKCNRGTHYGFLKITMLQNHFASTFCNFNVRNKRNRKMVPVTLLNHSVHVFSRHLL